MPQISTAVTIAISMLHPSAVGDTIGERFKAVIEPRVLSEACFMATKEDEQFRAAVGAVMLSYGVGTPEFTRIEAEMRMINQMSAMLQAAEVGLDVRVPEMDEGFKPIGLLGMWQQRAK